MPSIKSIHISPVKSLALLNADSVHVGIQGIAEDRRFLVRSRGGAMVTQRQIGRLALVKAEYSADSGVLRMYFPDGSSVDGIPDTGQEVEMKVFRRWIAGNVVTGDWGEALSDFCGAELTLVKTDGEGNGFDAYPVSLLSQASIEHLDNLTQNGSAMEYRRFRPNFLLDECSSHEEDTWLGKDVTIGDELRLRVDALDPRCAITTLNPDTGERDVDTPRLILRYRGELRSKGACFGVYGAVVNPGVASVGDEVRVGE